MGVIARTQASAPVPWRLLAIAIAVLIVAAGVVSYVGSRPDPLPAPFGAAANGSMYYHSQDGAIVVLDPATGTSTEIVSGSDRYVYPLPSRDGRRIVFEHPRGGTSQLVVAEADGANAHPLAGTYAGLSWTEWAPDDQSLAIVSKIDGRSRLSFVAADGSGTEESAIDREVKVAWYLPDGRLAMIAAASLGDRCAADVYESVCALVVSDRDGGEMKTVLDATAFSGLSLSPSPDGRSLLYVRWTDGDIGSLHVVDVASGVDRRVTFTNRDPVGDKSNTAEFSPDGSMILFDRYHGVDGEHFAVVPSAGGEVRNIGRAWDRPEGTLPEAHFSPDGKSVVAYYPTSTTSGELWLLDVAGQGSDRQLDVDLRYLPAWQRTAP